VKITVGSRGSPLARAQVIEVEKLLDIQFHPVWIETQGDRDKKTSLRGMDKSNFFTDEIDRRQVAGEFRIAIHSAKDLPDPLHEHLEIVALTQGVDPSDSLVVREFPLQLGSRIGTSSLRREQFLKQWRPDLICVDIRGTIEERLKLLEDGVVDGVVMAEAALIRLGQVHRPRLHLDVETAPCQGKLAVIAVKGDEEMRKVFQVIDTR